MEGKSIMKTVIMLAIALLLVAYIFPVGLLAIYGVSVSNFAFSGVADTATQNLFKLLPVFAIIAVVLMLIFAAIKNV